MGMMLDGKGAIVTGAGGGIERGALSASSARGRVCVVDVDRNRLAPIADLHSGAVCRVAAGVSSRGGNKSAIESARNAFERLDTFVAYHWKHVRSG